MSVHILSTGGKDPHWGPQTSKMNFCEEDYHFSAYFGEFINTLTSLTYVYLGGCALRRQWRIGSKAEISHSLPYIALIIVGIGSAAYHATLKYPLQLVDDLSMLLAAGIMSHYVITINMGTGIQFGLFLLITLTLLLASWAHIQLGDSTLHQVVFGSMVVTVGFRTVKLVRDMIPDKELSWKLRRLARMGTFTLLSAYGLWLIDVFACSYLRKARHAVGLPWAWILELHGWWHNLTGIGVYIYMIVAEFVRDPHRTETLGENDGYYELLKGPGSLRRGEQKQNGVLKTD